LRTYRLAKGTPIASKLAVFLWSGKARGANGFKVQRSGFIVPDQPWNRELLTLNPFGKLRAGVES